MKALLRALANLVMHGRREHAGTIFYTASSVAKAALGFLAAFVTMQAVAPADVGLWNSLTLVTTYAAFLQVGINNGLNRELPYHLGSGDQPRAYRLAATAQAVTVLSCFVAVVAGAVALFVFRGRDATFLTAIAVETIAVVCFFYQSYLVVTFRSTTSFTLLAKVELLAVGVGLVALPLVYYWGFPGMLWRIAGTSIVGIVLMHIVRPVRVSPAWDRESLTQLIRTGGPIFALFYIESTFSTFDRVFLLKAGGVEQVGYYSLALMGQQAMLVVPTAIAAYVYPRMTYHWGKHHDRHALWASAWKATAVAVLAMLPLVAAGLVFIPWMVSTFFPRYTPGISSAQILLVGSLFSGGVIGVNALWSLKAWRYMATYQVGSAGLRALGPFVGISMSSNPLIGVAVGTSVACALQFLLGLLLTFYVTMVKPPASAQPAVA